MQYMVGQDGWSVGKGYPLCTVEINASAGPTTVLRGVLSTFSVTLPSFFMEYYHHFRGRLPPLFEYSYHCSSSERRDRLGSVFRHFDKGLRNAEETGPSYIQPVTRTS